MQVANFQELQGLKSVVKLILKCKNKHHIRKNHPQPNICLTMSCVSPASKHHHQHSSLSPAPSTHNSANETIYQAKYLLIAHNKVASDSISVTNHFTQPIEKQEQIPHPEKHPQPNHLFDIVMCFRVSTLHVRNSFREQFNKQKTSQ